MKLLAAATVLSVVFSAAAYGGDNESPIKGKGPFSVVHNTPANSPRSGYTIAEINKSLDYFGYPHLGSSQVLHDDKARNSRYESHSTYETVLIHKQSK